MKRLPGTKAIIWLVFCLPPLLAGASEIYKYTDSEGIIHYTNIRPSGDFNYKTFTFPCYASDPKCHAVDWEQVPLNTSVFRDEIRTAASRYSIDESLIRAVIHAESAYQPDAVSPKGAQGLMQLMPETQAALKVLDPNHPETNIDSGSYHLSRLLQQFGGDVELAAAAYNAGAGAVERYNGVPPYTETREYVRRVQILYRRYRLAGT